jgi:hypothetical protein
MLITAKELKAYIDKWYGHDLDQPLFFICMDKGELHNYQFEQLSQYQTANDLPIDLVEKVFDQISEYDSFWDTLKDTIEYEVDNWVVKQDTTEIENLDKELWGDTNESK